MFTYSTPSCWANCRSSSVASLEICSDTLMPGDSGSNFPGPCAANGFQDALTAVALAASLMNSLRVVARTISLVGSSAFIWLCRDFIKIGTLFGKSLVPGIHENGLASASHSRFFWLPRFSCSHTRLANAEVDQPDFKTYRIGKLRFSNQRTASITSRPVHNGCKRAPEL